MQRLSCQGAPVQACASIFKIVLTPLHLFLSFTWKGSVFPELLVFFPVNVTLRPCPVPWFVAVRVFAIVFLHVAWASLKLVSGWYEGNVPVWV